VTLKDELLTTKEYCVKLLQELREERDQNNRHSL